MTKEARKRLFQWGSVLLSLGVIVGIGLLDPNVEELGKQLLSIQRLWLLAALGCMAAYWLSEAGILYLGCRYLPGHMSYGAAIRLSLIGQYYSALTPFSSGGQPFQVAYMRRWRIPVGGATGMFVLKFVYWQVGVSLAAIMGIARFWAFLWESPGLLAAALIGLTVNAAAGIVGALALSRLNVERPLRALVRLLHRIRIVKDEAKWQEKLHAMLDDFGQATALVHTHPRTAAGMALLTVAQIVGLFSVMFCIYHGYGQGALRFLGVIQIQSILNAAVAFVPLPGAMGATEGVFYLLYATLFPTRLIYAAMLIWRFLTYYLHLLIGAVITVVDSIASKRAPEPGV